MCEVTAEEKLKAVSVMLAGDALNYFAINPKGCSNYDDSMKKMRELYNSGDKKARILTKWRTMNLTNVTANYLTDSEVSVFRTFIAKLISLKKQLDPSCHNNNVLRDRLLTSIDILSIQTTLPDRMTSTRQ